MALIVPALEVVPDTERAEREGAMVTGENIPMSSCEALRYGRRPRVAKAKLSVAGQPVSFNRESLWMSRGARALKIWAVGRVYRYREGGNRRHHLLAQTPPHGVNVQLVTDPVGRLLWLSLALPGRAHDLTVAHTHRIIRICERQEIPIAADRACVGASSWVTTPLGRRQA